MILPNIAHADVSLNERNRVVIQMHEGWVFYDARDYEGWVDIEGNPIEPMPEDIYYFRYGVFALTNDLESRIIVVAESEVPENQIFGTDNNHEII